MLDELRFRRVMFLDDLRRWREKALLALVWRLPRTLVYWCAIRLMAHATTGKYGADDPTTLNVMEALKRW